MKIAQTILLSAGSLLFVGCDFGDKMVNEYEKNSASEPTQIAKPLVETKEELGKEEKTEVATQKREMQADVAPKESGHKAVTPKELHANLQAGLPVVAAEESLPPSEVEQNLAEIEAMNTEQEALLELEMQEALMPNDIDIDMEMEMSGEIVPEMVTRKSW